MPDRSVDEPVDALPVRGGGGVVVSGASGYLGRAITSELTRQGLAVTAVVRPSAGSSAPEAGGPNARGATRVPSVELDLASDEAPEALRRLLAGGAGYVHAAATPPPVTQGLLVAAVEAAGDLNRPVVMLQGALLYGPTGPTPVAEDAVLHVPPFLLEVAPVEARLLAATGARPVSVRIAGVHGGGGAVPGVLAAAVRADGRAGYPGTGDTAWSMIHVDDVARLVRVAVTDPTVRGPLNGASEDLTMRELARDVAIALGLPAEPVAWDQDQARARLGFFAEPLSWDVRLSAARARSHGWTPQGPRFAESIKAQLHAATH